MPETPDLSGIVVCGGQSSRMGKDKSCLEYHGRPQWQYMQEILSGLCPKVLLSVNADQRVYFPPALPLMEDLDAYKEKGPMAALLTAYDQLPGEDILLVGCDYPFLNQEELRHFLQLALKERSAIAFYNEAGKLYEPLLAFYPQEAKALACAQFEAGNYSLQSLLRQLDARKYIPLHAASINSADTPEAYRAALKITDPRLGFEKEG